MQTTNHLLMIRPVDFKFNEQTAGNNKFQQNSQQGDVHAKALAEFDGFTEILRNNGVDVTVVNDSLQPETPDSIFPNNWISFHEDGSVFLYPMFSENRRLERRKEIIHGVSEKFEINHINDLSFYEKQVLFLEGTGSMVLDRQNKIAYACLSLRTNQEVLNNFCLLSGFTAVSFQAVDATNFPIYHTNVMMCVADQYVVCCLASINNLHEKEELIACFEKSGKMIIDISFDQMNHFAGNMLQVENIKGEKLLVMSEQALKSLHTTQINQLESFNKIITAPIYTIEQNGGGSARCMLAEIHLRKK